MFIHCGLLLLCLNCVRTTEYFGSDEVVKGRLAEFNKQFSLWPSVHNAARLMRVRREAAENNGILQQSEGGTDAGATVAKTLSSGDKKPALAVGDNNGLKEDKSKNETVQSPTPHSTTGNATVSNAAVSEGNATTVDEKKTNTTIMVKSIKQIDLKNPGVLKRGFIVFGGFALLAVAYFIFYRRKGKKNDSGGAHTTIDANQFRYGVLQSEDRRDNMELSRVPLTMESDEDEDEDLEIFDLEQKKKSLSYVNLQTNDEDLVFTPKDNSTDNDRNNLLLDIEDGNSDTLINWSTNGSKSIL